MIINKGTKAWIYRLFMCGCLTACSKATEGDLLDGPEALLTFTTRLYPPSNYVAYKGVQYELSYAESFITPVTSEENYRTYYSLCPELHGKHGVSVLLTFNSKRYDLIPYYNGRQVITNLLRRAT